MRVVYLSVREEDGLLTTFDIEEYYARRDATRVCLLDSFERWKTVKEENNLKNDKEVAEMLLDLYTADKSSRESKNQLW